MNKTVPVSVLALFGACTWFGLHAFAQHTPANSQATGEIAAAAKTFLDTLDANQRGKVVFRICLGMKPGALSAANILYEQATRRG